MFRSEVWGMVECVEISVQLYFIIYANLGMWHAFTKFIHWLLIVEQKENQLKICAKCCKHLHEIVKHYYNEKGQHTLEWKQSRPNVKAVLFMLFDCWDLVHNEFFLELNSQEFTWPFYSVYEKQWKEITRILMRMQLISSLQQTSVYRVFFIWTFVQKM